MKILVISDLYPPNYIGGYELNCRDSVDALIAKGHEVSVLTSSWGWDQKTVQSYIFRLLDFDTDLSENEHSEELNVFKKGILGIRRILLSTKNYLITRRAISRIHPDVVYLWHLYYLTLTPALAVQDARIPMCFRIEDYSFARIKQIISEKGPLFKRIYRALIFGKNDLERLRPNNLIFISQFVKNYYLNAGFPEGGMDVIPSGVPPRYLSDPSNRQTRPFVAKDGVIRLVFSGRLEPEKGPDIAIKAIAKLKNKPSDPLVYLDIIGNGNPDFLDYLKRLARDNGIEDQVAFLGKIDQQEVQMRFQCYDALLFTSRWQEPFGRVLIEAMAQGLPIIAARTGGISEIIKDSDNGLLVLPDDPEDLAAAIRKLMHTPNLAVELSQNAFFTVRSRFTIKYVADRMENYLTCIVQTARAHT